MASLERLQKMVRRLAEAGKIDPTFTERRLRATFEEDVLAVERVPEWDAATETWQPWREARAWGEGPNEGWDSFRWEALEWFWGQNHTLADEYGAWPDHAPAEEALMAANWGIPVGALGALARLWQYPQPETLWAHFCAIHSDRSGGSQYYFGDLPAYVLAIEQIGRFRVLKYPKAATWAAIHAFLQEGMDVRAALALHARMSPTSALADVVVAYGLRAVCAAIDNGVNADPIALRVALRAGLARWAVDSSEGIAGDQDWLEVSPATVRAIPDDRYAHVEDVRVRSLLLRGVSPQAASDGVLSKKEAHQWLLDGCPDILGWLARHLGVAEDAIRRLVPGGAHYHRTTADGGTVVRWYAAKQGSPAIHRQRVWRGANGERFTLTLWAVIDEIHARDLVNGLKTSPDLLFERVMARIGERAAQRAGLRAAERDALAKRVFPAYRTPDTASVRQIRTALDLHTEGVEMNHCVANYASAAELGLSFYFSVRVGSHRSTLQVFEDGRVGQHYAAYDEAPPAACIAAVEAFMKGGK